MIVELSPTLAARVSGRPSLSLSPSFDEATARVEAALDELRAAEASLERQLADLRRYLRAETAAPVDAAA